MLTTMGGQYDTQGPKSARELTEVLETDWDTV